MKGMMKALFGMAISAGVFVVQQATDVLDGFKPENTHEHQAESPNAGFVIDHDVAMESRADAVGDVLIHKFDEMVLVDNASPDD